MVLLLALAVVIGVFMVSWPQIVPPSGMLVPLVIGDIVLGPRTLPWFVVLTLGTLVIGVAATAEHLDPRRIVGIVIVFLIGLIILVSSFRRTRLGVAGARGESMLVDRRPTVLRSSFPELGRFARPPICLSTSDSVVRPKYGMHTAWTRPVRWYE